MSNPSRPRPDLNGQNSFSIQLNARELAIVLASLRQAETMDEPLNDVFPEHFEDLAVDPLSLTIEPVSKQEIDALAQRINLP